jgi:ankyrin repeat protein
MKELIENKNYVGIRNLLSRNPHLANEGIPFDEINTTKAHPLHRICDGVFAGKYTDEEAVEIAQLFLEYGATVDGNELIEKNDTPLIAAASLHAEKVGILYIENGANIHHAGCSGGTALHWAAWCGRNKLVSRLVSENADINKRCVDYKATPLSWAIHGFKFGGEKNLHHQIECVRILIQSGADKTIPNEEGKTALDFLSEQDVELIKLLS